MVEDAVSRQLSGLDLAGQRLLVAVSGGIDSCALLFALRAVRDRHGFTLCVGHVDHGLRGVESAGDARFVAALAEEAGLAVGVELASPHPLREDTPNRDRPTLQEAARRTRYAALERIAARFGADRTATAHTLDDQAETVLMRLLRGTGPEGLGGIRAVSREGRLLRPLLDVSREEIVAYAEKHGIVWREDSSNEKSDYTRNRLRHDWIPKLRAEFNPQLLRAIGQLAEAQRSESDWMGELADTVAATLLHPDANGVEIEASAWIGMPDALARRIASRAMTDVGAGRYVSRVHLSRMLDFLRAGPDQRVGSAIELPGGFRLMRRKDTYHLGAAGV